MVRLGYIDLGVEYYGVFTLFKELLVVSARELHGEQTISSAIRSEMYVGLLSGATNAYQKRVSSRHSYDPHDSCDMFKGHFKQDKAQLGRVFRVIKV